MGDTEVVVERRIAAPIDQVWETLTDLESAPRVLKGVERVEVLTPGPFRRGTRWRETRRMLGRDSTEEMYVAESDAPHRCVVESEAKGARYVSEFALTPDEKGTTVRMTFKATPPDGFAGMLMKLFGGIDAKTVTESIERDLADIAATVESPTARQEPAPPEPA